MPRVARTVQTCKWNAELDATLSNLSNVRSDRVPPWLQLLHTPLQSMAMHRAGWCVCLLTAATASRWPMDGMHA